MGSVEWGTWNVERGTSVIRMETLILFFVLAKSSERPHIHLHLNHNSIGNAKSVACQCFFENAHPPHPLSPLGFQRRVTSYASSPVYPPVPAALRWTATNSSRPPIPSCPPRSSARGAAEHGGLSFSKRTNTIGDHDFDSLL